jgi:3-oxoacyl-[acyl-carrier-protein] synthase I
MLDQRTLSSLGGTAILECGARTALGTNAPATFSALRAGIGGFDECAFLRSKRDGAPIVVAMDTSLAAGGSHLARMEELALSAAREALAPWPNLGRGLPLGVLLAMAPDRPGIDGPARRQVAQSLIHRLGGNVSQPHCQMIATGHGAGLAGLFQAAQWLNARKIGACLVGGVESCVDLGFLDWLSDQGRLKDEEHPHGYCPGEASAFLLLVSAATAAQIGKPPLAWVAAVSRALEPLPWYTARPSRSQGLTAAIAGLFTAPPLRSFRTDVVYSDLNGEPWRADEWSLSYVRTADNQGEPLHIRHPADCWGDVGAASAPLLAAMASLEVAHPRMRSQSALVWTASEMSPDRGAALIVTEQGAT